MARWARDNGAPMIEGSFTAHLEAPSEHSVAAEVDVLVAPSGRYMVSFDNPITGRLHGRVCLGGDAVTFSCGQSVGIEQRDEMLEGLAAQVLE